jgi:nitric oxide reductase subunit B
MLGIGLMLFCLRALAPEASWRDRPLAIGFWALNGGLALMVTLSLLPIGILQTGAAVEKGTWWARSSDFLQTPLMSTLRWLRGPGDLVFAIGMLSIAYFVLGVMFGWSTQSKKPRGHTTEEPESKSGADAPAMARGTLS